MDWGTGLTAVGLVVTVIAAVIAWLQLRRTPHTNTPVNPAASGGRRETGTDHRTVRTNILPPPTGHLPHLVRGRDRLLNDLRALVKKPDGKIHLLSGMGGVGKTSVALQIAAEAQAEGRPTWWVPATDAQTFALHMLGLARELGATAGEVEEALEGRRRGSDLLWRLLDDVQGWLLVIDNADDPRALDADQPVAGGNGWLRPTSTGLVLVTTRARATGMWGRHTTMHKMNVLPPQDGACILLDLVPEAGSVAEAENLSARLGGLPLALRHAGMHLSTAFALERNFVAYQEALDSPGDTLMRPDMDDRANLTMTWELSLDLLAARDMPQARALLGVLSCFPAPTPIPAVLLDHATLATACEEQGRGGVSGGLAALDSVGLIEEVDSADKATRGVALHPLVAEVTRRKLFDSPLGGRTAAVAVSLVARAVGTLSVDRSSDWPIWAQLHAHVRGLWLSVIGELDDESLAVLAEATAVCAMGLTYGGSYHVALSLTGMALGKTEGRLPSDSPAVLDIRHRHASAKMFLGLAAEAEREFRAVLAGRVSVLGPHHPKTLIIRHNLARVLADQGRLDEAGEQFAQALAAKVRVLGPEDPDTLATRHEAARVLLAQGKAVEAETEHRAIHATKLKVLGPEHPDTLVSRQEIPRSLLAQGRAVEAERELREILGLRMRLLGGDHPHVLNTSHWLAAALAAQGRYEEAGQRFVEVLEARRRVLGAENTYTLATQEALTEMRRRAAQPAPEEGDDAPGAGGSR
ncbi:tetratricopeptide repeat protein [Nonomuraea sp. SMC257]|uniref:Tetratricopeptide repeat protein n=1 Tax=Nonomuraea montanisoli TaxID=2741721 RepID=A0A7Y6IE22_9ACTN|nr:tetratricopeptide repeat protein [Nonomuraea montanisoli]NUW36502.1 tetratricopeptide repeat protein [Nonomuraea montanisoli]